MSIRVIDQAVLCQLKNFFDVHLVMVCWFCGVGNFSRIRCAFAFGAQKLEEALMVPEELVHKELRACFANTIKRNKRRARSNRQVVLSTGSTASGPWRRGCASNLVSVPTDGASGSKIGPESSNYAYRNAHLQNALKSQSMPCIDSIRRATRTDGKTGVCFLLT